VNNWLEYRIPKFNIANFNAFSMDSLTFYLLSVFGKVQVVRLESANFLLTRSCGKKRERRLSKVQVGPLPDRII